MKKVCRICIIVPVIYTAIALLLLMLHLIQQDNFTKRIGQIEFKSSKTIATGNKPAEYRSLSILFDSFEYSVNASNPVTIITEDHISHKLHIEDVTFNNLDIIIHFNYNIKLVFRQNNDDSLDLLPSIPELTPPVESISLSLVSGAGLQPVEGFPEIYKQIIGDNPQYLHLPRDAQYINRQYLITLPVVKTTEIQPVKISRAGPQKGETAEQWLVSSNPELIDSEQLLDEYSEIIYDGLQRRFISKSGTWNFMNGIDQYSENAVNLLLAESLNRKEYIQNRYLMLNAADSMEPGISFQSSPFLGDIVNKGSRQLNKQILSDSKIGSMLQGENTDIFNLSELSSYIIRYPEQNTAIYQILMKSLSEAKLPAETLSGLFTYLNAETTGYGEISGLEIIQDFLKDKIIPLLLARNDGFFLFPESGQADCLKTLYTARILEMAFPEDEKMRLISAGLIRSVLSLADEDGFIPEYLVFTNNSTRISKEIYTGDFLIPEEMALILFELPYYPHFASFEGQNDNTIWLWSASNGVEIISRTSNEMTFSIRFPKDGTHHLAFFNIEPFEQVIFHGMQFRSDYRFESYSDGWLYDKGTGMLFFKIKHLKEVEYITIRKTAPQSAATTTTVTETKRE